MQDVKSVYGGPSASIGPGVVGAAKTFNGDVIQRPVIDFGNAQFTAKDNSQQVYAQLPVRVHYSLAH